MHGQSNGKCEGNSYSKVNMWAIVVQMFGQSSGNTWAIIVQMCGQWYGKCVGKRMANVWANESVFIYQQSAFKKGCRTIFKNMSEQNSILPFKGVLLNPQ